MEIFSIVCVTLHSNILLISGENITKMHRLIESCFVCLDFLR